MPKIIDYELKRQEIMEMAGIVFAKHGYQRINLSHIAEKCGMGRTTLYQYFKNKDEIFYHIMRNVLEEIKVQV